MRGLSLRTLPQNIIGGNEQASNEAINALQINIHRDHPFCISYVIRLENRRPAASTQPWQGFRTVESAAQEKSSARQSRDTASMLKASKTPIASGP
ncbi:hypothetical protein M8R19_27580 [Pseudomonas sp. R3.Fl]|uniref:hypothetical protein n=1 Tax=Pseudomonas TaxID=286 RepID=UPI001080ECFF|nr:MULTISPECIES: hypothetical protein [Pseudomonas]MCL6692449.1 hypothetical protein [Pseudomonas sp. R3.Fl]